MNKTAIKNFAVWARNKLIADITYKAGLIGVSEKGIAQPLPQSSKDLQFFNIGTKDYAQVAGSDIEQRNALVRAIQEREANSDYATAFKSVVEEVAYTWFNRLIAIRFMEVNDYLPSRIRVLSSENSAKNEPDFVTTPFDTDMEFTTEEQDKIMQLKDENKLDELFRMLFIKQCNKLHEILPELFEETNDYTELLLGISFTDNDGIVYHLVHDIDEDDFNIEKEGQVEIIGWMYQYYNSEPKDALINAKKQYKKEDIPFVTQLFTSEWIVKYMVENTLGEFWAEQNKEFMIPENWRFYIEKSTSDNLLIKKSPEKIKVFDPCMGSGHILVYSFEVLMQIYESKGYTQRDAASLILEKNIYGLDIDKRAYQLAYFSLIMQARKYNRRLFSKEVNLNIACIEDSQNLDNGTLELLGKERQIVEQLIDNFENAKEYGSLLYCEYTDRLDKLEERIIEIAKEESTDLFAYMARQELQSKILPLIKQAKILSKKYEIVITNPPYMATKYMTSHLKEYVAERFNAYKADLFASFIVRCSKFCTTDGQIGMLTPYVWMFIQSYEELRKYIYNNMTISSLVQLEFNAFEAACVPVAAFTFRNTLTELPFEAIRLSEFKGIDIQEIKTLEAVQNKNCGFRYTARQKEFVHIPGAPVAYWASQNVFEAFKAKKLGELAEPRQGMTTSDNNRFLREWYEVDFNKIYFNAQSGEDAKASGYKWFPYNKGGGYRKWYGNIEYIINYKNDGEELQAFHAELNKTSSGGRIKNKEYYFKESLTWTFIAITPGFRYCPPGFIFDVAGSSMFIDKDIKLYTLGFLCSCVATHMLNILNPTMNIQANDIKGLPLIIDANKKGKIEELVQENIKLCKEEWDSVETSWDYSSDPLLKSASSVEIACDLLFTATQDRVEKLKENEEKLNKIFLEIYNLENSISYRVPNDTLSISAVCAEKSIKNLLSYAVGCMFGRYSLDEPGMAYAGGEWNDNKYSSFIPDKDNCIPITDEEYFEDDIVGMFCDWLEKVYGQDTLEENLDFIAKVLGNKGATSREVIRNYFLTDFIKDHIKTYQKRPIYWLFDSGKQNGFKALVYMHRWNADTVGNLRVEYLHKMQHTYEREIVRMQETIDNSRDSREVSKATKRKDKLQKQLKETKDYDAKLTHIALSRIEIDLDDGVKVNYEKVQTGRDGKKMQILAKI